MTAPPVYHGGFIPLIALSRRELVRFTRQPTRIAAAVGSALLMWTLLGSGFARAIGDGAYAAYLLPGMATMVVLFSSIFAAMSLIEDRNAGFLQSVLVSPAPRWSLIGSKIVGGSVVAWVQAAVLLPAAPLLGLSPGLAGYVQAALALLLMSVGLIGFCLAAAWYVNSTQGFHGVMNVVLMPAWLLSGAIFPLDAAAGWIGAIMRVNPLSWVSTAMGRGLMGEAYGGVGGPASVWAAAVLFAAGGFVLAWATVGRRARVSPQRHGGHGKRPG
jgi:ABC-2 type transport system permease protein